MNCFKIIARDKKTGRQYKKWEYIGEDKFNKHSPEIIKRYSKPMRNRDEYEIEIYDMMDGLWRRIK